MGRTKKTEAERFWAKVQVTGFCWLWTAAEQNGYGVFMNAEQHNVKSHRWSYEHLVGPIQGTLDHLCRVGTCVNPDHLEDVPQGENNRRTRGLRQRRTHCPRGHSYAEHGRDQSGHPVCRVCDAMKKRDARRKRWALEGKTPRRTPYGYSPAAYGSAAASTYVVPQSQPSEDSAAGR